MIQKIVRDSIKTIGLGLAIGAGLFVILWIIGTLAGGWENRNLGFISCLK